MNWVLVSVAGVSLIWAALAVRDNVKLHRLLAEKVRDYEALALRSETFEKRVEFDIELVIDLYEKALAEARAKK